jgi:AraC family transcriptional regulator of adaptative response / DNA-3-methyladenine glycosylase II
MLDRAECEGAMLRRDPAFDGRIFVAVRTTRIYCRPVCPVRQPRLENVRFYPSAAAAERAGYRPCLRCRPETAPFCPAWNGTRTTVERALRLIEAGALDRPKAEGGGVDALADRLGVGSRHVSRLFARHLDASPLQVAKTLRVQRAKRLLTGTELPIVEVAEQAGFPSARRMAAAFAELYGRAPSDMRRGRARPTAGSVGADGLAARA